MDDLTLMWQSAPVRQGGGVGAADVGEWFQREMKALDQPSLKPQPLLELDEPEESLEGLAAKICSLAGRLASFTHDWLVLIAEFDRRKGWVQWEMKSCVISWPGPVR